MHIKAIASAALFASVLGLGGAAYAQTMIGNQTVSEADMERVKVYCEDLKTADTQAEGATAADAVPVVGVETDALPAEVGAVDMDAITLENCIEAGFVER